jgi:hypothetical protein
MHARVQIESLVHRGVRQARRRQRKLGLGERTAGVPRRLEPATLHPRERHGFARAVRRRLVRGVRVTTQETAARASGRTEGAPLTAAERNLRDALARMFADPIGCEDEIATLIAQVMTAPVDFSDARRTTRLKRNRSDPGAPHAGRATPHRTR